MWNGWFDLGFSRYETVFIQTIIPFGSPRFYFKTILLIPLAHRFNKIQPEKTHEAILPELPDMGQLVPQPAPVLHKFLVTGIVQVDGAA